MPSIAPPSHTRRAGITTDSWITPKWLLDRLGPFDLDPCASDPQPWPTAEQMVSHGGLDMAWHGLVWLNPPYGKQLGVWLERMANHNNGIALTFARTDTMAFHAYVWPKATTLLFMKGRLSFFHPSGEPSPCGHSSGGPSVLIGYGAESIRLSRCSDIGALVKPR